MSSRAPAIVRLRVDRVDRLTLQQLRRGGTLVLLLFCAGRAGGANFDGAFATTNDYGDVGLLQTPTARMRTDGEFGIGISRVKPYNQVHIFLQPLPWLETAVRYTDITNRLYGPSSFSGSQSLKDKSADFKVRLLGEGRWWPAIAIGVQDIGGTGVFSSEYLVSSLHFYDFDFSGGLAWGRLGSGGSIRNPLALISNHFDNQRFSAGQDTQVSRLFAGHDIGAFGGVQWNTPLRGLSLQVEYDGNDYKHEVLGNVQKQSTPVNVALNYRRIPGVDFGVGFERGQIVTARVSLHLNFQDVAGVAKFDDPKLPALKPPVEPEGRNAPASETAPAASPITSANAAQAAAVLGAGSSPLHLDTQLMTPPAAPLVLTPNLSEAEKERFVLDFKASLPAQGFSLAAVDFSQTGDELTAWIYNKNYRNPAKAAGRIARLLSSLAPPGVKRFVIVNMERGAETYRVAVVRDDFGKVVRGAGGAALLSSAVTLAGPENSIEGAAFVDATRNPQFDWDMGPAVRQYLGGPDSFYIGQLFWKVDGSVTLTDHLTLSGSGGVNLINNFDQLKQTSDSELPHVRTDIASYLKRGKNGLIKLEANYIWSPLPNLYARLSGGIFEEMYAGAGGELLYRPYGSDWAVGLDVNKVYQRGYDQLLDFRDYSVVTGHATLYYRLPFYHLLAKVSVGRYLARDKGGTVDVSREFASGVRAGIFATKTNVSAARFGEGRFDKGVYLSIPLDLFFTQSTRRRADVLFRPLTRDGGQKVRDGEELYPIFEDGHPDDFADGWPGLAR